MLALEAGVAWWLAFPGHDYYFTAPLGVGLLVVATRAVRVRHAAALGGVAGFTFFLLALAWSGTYVGWFPWIALSVVCSAYVAAFAAGVPLLWRLPWPAMTLGVAGLWVASESLRSRWPFGGFPWARLAFSQADAPSVGLAVLGGAPLVSGAVAATGCLAAHAIAQVMHVHGRATQTSNRAVSFSLRWRQLGTPLLMVGCAAALYLGPLLLPGPITADRAPTNAESTLQVSAIQGNVPTAGLDFNAQRRAVLDNHAALTRQAARDIQEGVSSKPDVVIWPENSSDIDPFHNPDAAGIIQNAADVVGSPVVVGAVLVDPPGFNSNTTIAWWPRTAATPGPQQRYVKRHPAPFAEYIPMRSFFRMISKSVDLVPRDFVAGNRVGVFAIPTQSGVIAQLGDLICFEVAYDDLTVDVVRHGANVLMVQTNNATFGYTDESVQQLAISRFRAIETGRSVVHISTVGVSALIRPDGSMIERSDHFVPQILSGALALSSGLTPAVRWGPQIEHLLNLWGLLLTLIGWAARRRLQANGAHVASFRPRS